MNFKKNVNIAKFPYSLIDEVKPHSKHIHMVWHASFVCWRLWSSFQTETKELNFALFSWFYTFIFFYFFFLASKFIFYFGINLLMSHQISVSKLLISSLLKSLSAFGCLYLINLCYLPLHYLPLPLFLNSCLYLINFCYLPLH